MAYRSMNGRILPVLLLAGAISACAGKDEQPQHDAESGIEAVDLTRLEAALTQSLATAFPRATVAAGDGRETRAFGAVLATGESTAAAAESARQQYAAALGLGASDLVPVDVQAGKRVTASQATPIQLMYDKATGQHRFSLYRYRQMRSGVPVHDAELSLLARNDGQHAVVWAASTLQSLSGFNAAAPARVPNLDADKVLRVLGGSVDVHGARAVAPKALARVSTPELVVFAGKAERPAQPVLATESVVETENPPGKWRVITRADNGDVLHTEDLILFEDVPGSVQANATTGYRGMQCADEVPMPLPFAEVTSTAGGLATADASGAFLLSNPGTDPVTLTSRLGGPYFDVTNAAGANLELSQLVTPPGSAAFLHNLDNASDTDRAQVNGYVNSSEVRSFLLSYLPNYPTISSQLNFPVKVNLVGGSCPGNAWYDYSSINFCLAGSSYSNTSFASVNHHEYGHHIVTSGGSGQGAYGEGMSDTVAMLIAKDPGLGYGFYAAQCSSPLRNADNTCQYSATSCSSCGSAVHSCGNLISGTIWDVRQHLLTDFPETADEILRPLVLSSIPMHSGTAINSQIAIDLLTLDDTDGNIANGSPHYAQICAGFAEHGMSCPALQTGLSVSPIGEFSASGPVGGPFAPGSATYVLQNLGPEQTLSYEVNGAPTWLDLSSSAGTIELGQTTQIVVSLDQVEAASLPKDMYTAALNFVNVSSSAGTQSRNVKLEVGAPVPIYTATFESGMDNFTVGASGVNLWHRSASCADSATGHSAPGSLYFGADATCTFQSGSSRVYGDVESPAIAVNNSEKVELRFNYALATEGGTYWDRATVAASVNGGVYTTVASSTGTGFALLQTAGTWLPVTVDITSLFTSAASSQLRLRFSFDSGDGVANSYTGFVVDDVQVRAVTETCAADAECDDGLFCNGVETCVGQGCSSGTPVLCSDGVSCTTDVCDEATDTCVAPPNDALCSDLSVCNGVETCGPTGCSAGTPLNCNDNNACTTDSCNAATGCATTPVTCNDNNVCTTDSCNPATGCATTPVVCSDNNECTNDTCDPVTGCAFSNRTGSCTDDGNACTSDVCNAGACTHPDNGSCGPKPFQESSGQVVMEAENFEANTARASHTWDLTNDAQGSGGKIMVSNPNNNTTINSGYVGGSPELRYKVNFVTTGTYYVWVRGQAPSGSDDSCHVGLDNTAPTTSDRMGNFSNSWAWTRATMDGPVATLSITTTGVHAISLYMREDGFKADKLLLTTNNNFTPTGMGPAESPRQSAGCSSDAACNDNNPCTADVCSAGTCQNTAVSNGTACADDGNVCTNDMCNAGQCTHPNNTASCADDGNSCTSDVCSAGACTHPSNGSCPNLTPCSAYCANPVSFSGNYNSGNLGTAATCHQTTGNIAGGNCGNFANGRQLRINGTVMTCNNGNWSALPAKVNGGYCVYTTAGDFSWAYFTTW